MRVTTRTTARLGTTRWQERAAAISAEATGLYHPPSLSHRTHDRQREQQREQQHGRQHVDNADDDADDSGDRALTTMTATLSRPAETATTHEFNTAASRPPASRSPPAATTMTSELLVHLAATACSSPSPCSYDDDHRALLVCLSGCLHSREQARAAVATYYSPYPAIMMTSECCALTCLFTGCHRLSNLSDAAFNTAVARPPPPVPTQRLRGRQTSSCGYGDDVQDLSATTLNTAAAYSTLPLSPDTH
ncbi:hypothetical protein BJ912DRAFT_1056683 [Pholiota molesta]|nr:hypothetical protein BJ912DRAFT_1056683 [Pholiota molesta]